MSRPRTLRSRLARGAGMLTALAVTSLVLTGCMKIDIDLEINPDSDTVSGSMVLAIEKSMLQLSGKSPEDAFADAKQQAGDLPEGSRTEVYEDEDYYGQRVIFEDTDFAAFSGNGQGMVITHTDGRYTFTADMGSSTDSLGPEAALAEPFLSGISFRVAITFPGRVIEHNGDELDGRTVIWDVDLAGEDEPLRAVSRESPFPFAVAGWVVAAGGACLLVVLLIVGLLTFLLLRQRRGRRQPDATPPTHHHGGSG